MWLVTDDSMINFDLVSSIRIRENPPNDPDIETHRVVTMEVSVKTPKVLFKGSFDDCQQFLTVLQSWMPREKFDFLQLSMVVENAVEVKSIN